MLTALMGVIAIINGIGGMDIRRIIQMLIRIVKQVILSFTIEKVIKIETN